MSELSKLLTFEKFKIAYEKFLEQADKNMISGNGWTHWKDVKGQYIDTYRK